MAVAARDEIPEYAVNPIDLVEEIASAHDWLFERKSDDEMSVEISGQWSDYRMFFSWLDDLHALHFACAFEMRVTEYNRANVNELLAIVNEKMPVGHFDLWLTEGLLVFRHSTLLRGGNGPSVEQLEDLVTIAISECERFFPAFQYVVWGGKAPAEAVSAAMLETVGEA